MRSNTTNPNPLFKESNILNLRDTILLNNLLMVFDHVNKNLPCAFTNYFSFNNTNHQYETRELNINVPRVKTFLYGSKSIKLNTIRQWNRMKTDFKKNTNKISRAQFIKILKKDLLKDC